MACKDVNKTPEEIINILRNKGFIFDITPEDTLEDILQRLDFINRIMNLPEGENQLYHVFQHVVGSRVSFISKGAYIKRKGKTRVEKEENKPDFIKQKNAGTRVHSIAAQIMDFLYNGVGDMNKIRQEAAQGEYAVRGLHFNSLVNVVNEIIKDVNSIQNEINKDEKAVIKVEQKVLDSSRDIGGALDVLAIFSDKTHARYDYKTAHAIYGKNFMNGQLTDELLTMQKVGDYELAMAEYGRILEKVFGLKGARRVRLVPIHIALGIKPEGLQADYDRRNTKIQTLQAGSKASQFLTPLPVLGEETKYHGLNKLLDTQWKRIIALNEKLTKKLNIVDRERIERQISELRKSIKRTIVDGDIFDILDGVIRLTKTVNTKLKEEELVNGEPNPKYIDNIELNDIIDELYMYADIIDNTHTYYKDLYENNRKEFDRLKTEIDKVSDLLPRAIAEAKMQREQRFLKQAIEDKDKYTDEKGVEHLKPLKELGFWERNFMKVSELDGVAFRTLWKYVQDAYLKMNRDIRAVSDKISRADKDLRVWAKSSGMTVKQAQDKIIDFTTGTLVSEISKELQKKIHDAYANPNITQASKAIKSIMEIADLDLFKKSYQMRYERFYETEKSKNKTKAQLDKALANFSMQYDLLHSPSAWANQSNRKFLKISDKVKSANLSPEYQELLKHKPLLDYYNTLVEYNNEFRKILGITDYKDLPYNFIPNIRKTMIDTISQDGLSVKAIGREFIDSLHIREEDVQISDLDASGNIKRTIPILFLNPLVNSDGEVDLTKKSYDLSKNLMIFSKMAFNYKYMSEIEPVLLQLKAIVGDPTSEQGGTRVTDKHGRNVKGKMGEWLTKKGFDTDTYKLLEDLIDSYLYGIKFKGSNVGGSTIDTTKLLLKMKQYYGKSTLAFAVIPGISAYIGGITSSWFEGSKGVAYTNKMMRQAHLKSLTNFKEYKALGAFIDAYAENINDVLAEKHSRHKITREATYRNMMYTLRKPDEYRTDAITNAMAYNYGLTSTGELIRLNRTTGIKATPIEQLVRIDPETGRGFVEGMTDEAFIQFRNAVKSECANVFGSLDERDRSNIDLGLGLNVAMQFKNWMPGIVYERGGGLKFDNNLQAARWGRYRAVFADFGLKGHDDLQTAFELSQYLGKVFLPNLKNFLLDLSTFGLAPKLGLIGETYTDAEGKERKVRTNINRAKRMYYKYMEENDNFGGQMTFEDFLEVKEAQMKAFMIELRSIISLMAILSFLGGGVGDDGEQPPYMKNWFTRFSYKTFAKAQSELTFMWSPAQFVQLIKNPIPMTGLLTRGINTIVNGFDETRDLLFGENSVNDKTPSFYYLIQWTYGGGQLARFFELYKQFEKSPYTLR